MARIGFTGTRRGMTKEQLKVVLDTLLREKERELVEVVHGDCVGADFQFHKCAAVVRNVVIDIRPCTLENQRAFCVAPNVRKRYDPEAPLERNRKIVDTTDGLIVCPGGFKEEIRSGTWATYRYAKKHGKAIMLIWPDGLVEEIVNGVVQMKRRVG